MHKQIDLYFRDGCGRCPLGGTPQCKVHHWTEVLKKLRAILLDSELIEELKWGVPCYSYQNKNVVIMSALKEYCALGFFKGVLLKDPHHLLISPGVHSQAVKQFRFTQVSEVVEMEIKIKAYIAEAVEIEKSGLKVEFRKIPEPVPDALQQKFDEDPVFKTAFDSLTPGRQRGYIIYFSQPKQAKTRRARIEKYMAMILNGEGMPSKQKPGGQELKNIWP